MKQKATLIAAHMLSPSVRLLRFEPEQAFDFIAGQWVSLYIPHLPTLAPRSYSIASAPEPKSGIFELAITYVQGGPVSSALHTMPTGDTLEIDGPHGFFVREPAHQSNPSLFIATGTGLAPIRSMLDATLPHLSEQHVLLFGSRTHKDELWAQQWHALSEQYTNFHYLNALSQPLLSTQRLGTHQRQGRVQTQLPEALAQFKNDLDSVHVYICGLSQMVKDVRRELKSTYGLGRKQIHTERFD